MYYIAISFKPINVNAASSSRIIVATPYRGFPPVEVPFVSVLVGASEVILSSQPAFVSVKEFETPLYIIEYRVVSGVVKVVQVEQSTEVHMMSE